MCIHIRMHVCTHTYHTHTYTHTHTHTRTHTHTHIHAHTRTRTHMHTHMHAHTYTQIYTYMYYILSFRSALVGFIIELYSPIQTSRSSCTILMKSEDPPKCDIVISILHKFHLRENWHLLYQGSMLYRG